MDFTEKAKCPGCGADIEFKSTDSLFAVCKYCQTTIGKSSKDIDNHGVKSKIVEDFSKIQIGTTGNYRGRQFSIIGRIQIKYIYGLWNEWYILFSDGGDGWLSDLVNEFIITVEYAEKNKDFLKKSYNIDYSEINKLVSFDRIDVDTIYKIGNQSLLAVDVTAANIVGVEGEVSFDVFNNKMLRVADFRIRNLYSTIDYSSNDAPVVYFGESIPEEGLQLANKKTLEEINSSNKFYKDRLTSFKCPTCGNGNPKVSGETTKIFCISCGSQIDVSENVAKLLSGPSNYHDKIETTLRCGNVGTINGKKYIVIGVIIKESPDGESEWVEYFLYQKGGQSSFLWLVEDKETNKWSTSEGIRNIPQYVKKNIQIGSDIFKEMEDGLYWGETKAVWGSFNWEININDSVKIQDYNGYCDKKACVVSKEIMMHQSNENVHFEVSFSMIKNIGTEKILSGFNIRTPAIHTNMPNLISYMETEGNDNKQIYIYFAVFQLVLLFALNLKWGLGVSIGTLLIHGPLFLMLIGLAYFIESFFITDDKDKK